MAKNDFLARQAATQRAYFDAGLRSGRQQILDMVSLVLRDPDIMGKDTFGKDRIVKLYDALKKEVDFYHVCFTDDKEADYFQEKMDAELREIWGDELQPFYERYPYIKKFDYSKARKNWR